jgi:phage-related protein
MKVACFLGTARQDLAAFLASIRQRAGYELFMVQVGREPADFRPIPSVGPGACEIRVRDESGAFRVIYVAKFEHAVYVLHAFQKKTRKTPQADVELAARRYKMIGEQS